MPRGGYQRPSSPAPASGPGKLSQRTDGQPVRALSDAAYGEQATYRADQQGAPMATAPQPGQAPSAAPADLSSVVPMGAGTQRPGEPITAGAATGAGPGLEALGMAAPGSDPGDQYIKAILPTLVLAANLPSAGVAFRQWVRRIRGSQ